MNTQDVIEFFDSCAPAWDQKLMRNDSVINRILDNAQIGKEMKVLDVACGTGVLFPYYLGRNVDSVVGVDISGEMIRIAEEKFRDEPRITLINSDIEMLKADACFERIVVYNAFPHFPDPEWLLRVLVSMLRSGGRLTIAHGESREKIDAHHRGAACRVSNGLMRIEELKALCDPYLNVDVMISDERMYQICGTKKAE